MTSLHTSAVVPVTSWAAAFQQAPLPPSDSVVVESPLPGGLAAVTRFLLTSVPQWVQIAGLILAALVAAFVLRYLVRHRRAIREWLATRSRGTAIALGATALVVVTAVIGMGAATWNYTQHSNEFCTSCHVMGPAFQKFGSAENKHGELSCHDCHQQSVFASVHELYVWLRERPEEIGAHAKVPNRVCETCHVTSDTAKWRRVAGTAGHRVHLESDSSALDSLLCVTCHGEEVHRFRPVRATCGQSGCHAQDETNIMLGKMQTQTIRHCTTCHAFSADVPALATVDSASGTMVPGQLECFGCHDMRRTLADFDATREPHGAKCGTCHNPHTQKTPADARATCTTSGCHANWRDEPFHTGAAHRKVGERCLTCHNQHAARVDASDCAGCHADVRSRGNLRPPVPFDTTKALRRTSAMPHATPRVAGHAGVRAAPATAPALESVREEERDPPLPESEPLTRYPFTGHWPGDPGPEPAPPPVPGGHVPPAFGDNAPARASWPPPTAADTFSHPRHAKLACLVCHQTGTGLGRLTFQRPRGCTICHHQAPAQARCASCHQPNEVAAPIPTTVTVTVAGRQPAARPVDFVHSRHTAQPCLACHTTPVTLAPSPAVAQCKDCHTEHHAADRTCSACHAVADAKAAHPNPEAAHQRCDACHTGATVAQLTPTRTFCATCHAPKAANHYDQKQCTTCHFLVEPGAYRAKLTTPPK